MNSEVRAQLITEVERGGEAYVRNLAAAEAAVLRGQFNLAKVLRAAAHTQRTMAMVAARLLVSELEATPLLQTILSELEQQPAPERFTSTPDADVAVQGKLAQLSIVRERLKEIINRSLASLSANRDVLESDVAQFMWACYGCGYLYEARAPHACEICGALSVEFESFGPFYVATSEHLGQLSPTEILATLESIPSQVAAIISNVSDEVLGHKPSAEEWSVKEIVGHMLETDLLFVRRVRVILESQGVTTIPRTVPPWTLHEGKGYEDLSASQLLARLREARSATLELVRTLSPKQWTEKGTLLGSTMSVLDFGSWLTNRDRGHLAQIRERC